jgi:hypothetical protein
VTKLATSGTELDTGRLIVKKDARPGGQQDFSLTAGAGLSPSSFTLDDDPADSTLSDVRVFNSLAAGSYSISESPTPDWVLASAACDDGSPPSNIDVAPREIVTCTFVNDSLGTYARPIAANSASVALVPAFDSCTTANSTHSAPLALPSCNPPTQSSPYLTFNAPDRVPPQSGPAGNRSHIQLQLACIPGRPPPCGPDQQDIRITGSITDVRCLGSSGGCTGPGAAYTGKLYLKVPVRITDRFSGPTHNTGATLVDSAFTLNAGLLCGPDGDCNVDTSVDSVWPVNFVKEGKRTVWELGQVEVLDGGQDGDLADPVDCPPSCFPNDDETRFLTQGVFAP